MSNVPNYVHEDREINDPGLTADRNELSLQVEKLTIFVNSLVASPKLPVLSSISPDVASAGDTVTIRGTDLLSTSSILIGQVPLSGIQVVSSTQVKALLPTGITSGSITLTTPAGSVTGLYFTKFNAPPSVGVLSVTPGTIPARSGPITLSVGATDSDGIQSVEFQRAVTSNSGPVSSIQWVSIGSVGTATNGVYTINYSPLVEEVITIRAKATDTLGAFALSNVVTVTVTAVVLQPATAPSLIANDDTNTLRAVLYNGDFENAEGIEININNTGWQSYDGSVINVGDVARVQGYYKFRTAAIVGVSTASPVVSSPAFTVAVVVIPAPTLGFLSPSSGIVGTMVGVTGGGFVNVTSVTLNGAPTAFSSTSTGYLTFLVPAGATSGNVVVTNGSGSSNGLPFTVVVPNQAPTVTLTSPSAQSINQGDSLAWSATAADGDGSIQTVELLVSGNSVQTDSSSPYGGNYTFATSGTFQVAARATDNQNLSTTSSSVTITVIAQPATYQVNLANGETDNQTGILFTAASGYETGIFRYNRPVEGDTTSIDMTLLLNGTEIGLVNHYAYLVNQSFGFTLNGNHYTGTFANGNSTITPLV